MKTLEEHLGPARQALAEATAAHGEAASILTDARETEREEQSVSSRQHLENAIAAEETTRADLEIAQRELGAATERARREIICAVWPELAALIKDVDRSFAAFTKSLTRLDERRARLIEQVGGAKQLVPLVSPLPYASERMGAWREVMQSSNLL